MSRFRYSRSKFWLALIVSLGLTLMITGLTWMITLRLGYRNADLITAFAGLVFLAFFSARMALQFWRDDIVLAILPTGINDVRWNRGLVEWELIKEISLRQRETEFELIVHMWPNAENAQDLPINISSLDGDAQAVTEAIGRYMPIRTDY